MMDSIFSGALTINLGGVVVSIQSGDPELNLKLAEKYELFTSAESAKMTLEVHPWGFPFPKDLQANFAAETWSYYRIKDKIIFKTHTKNRFGQFKNHTAVIDKEGQKGELFMEEEEFLIQQIKPALEIPPYPISELLGIQLILGQPGLWFHACGIKSSYGHGLLFAGISGSGKSTTARLWQQAGAGSLLSDERVAVCRQKGQYWIYGTPWHEVGLVSSPDCAPLKKIFIISHAATHKVRALKPSEAVTALIVRSFLPFWDAESLASALAFLDELCQTVPCFELGFVPDQSVVDYVRCPNAS